MRSFFFLLAISLGMIGCNKDQGPNPAEVNLATPGQAGPAASTPAGSVGPAAPETATEEGPYTEEEGAYNAQLMEASEPPPPLPQYSQPPCPGEDYIWTPGYWGLTEAGYYWVPGAWVLAPYTYALWTPPYWYFSDGLYHWHHGYWGPHIGFYGGINYGFGYTGLGFWGGYWSPQGVFVYNRTVTNVDPAIVHNLYRHSVVNYTAYNRVSYNGGRGGIERRPTAPELAAMREPRIGAVAAQIQHVNEAAANGAQFARENRGHPALSASARPLPTLYRAPAAPPPSWQRAAEQSRRNFNARLENPRTAAGREQAPLEERPGMRAIPGPAAPAPLSREERAERQVPRNFNAKPENQPFPETRGQARPEEQPGMRTIPAPRARAAASQMKPEPRPEPFGRAAAPPMRPVPPEHPEARPIVPQPFRPGQPSSRPMMPAPQQHAEARPSPPPQPRPAPAARAPQPPAAPRPEPGRGQPAPGEQGRHHE
jgi:WXXGXW repeat (2 copies)